jgi:hypothetical protein
VSGSADAVKEGVRLIKEVIADFENGGDGGGGGGGEKKPICFNFQKDDCKFGGLFFGYRI